MADAILPKVILPRAGIAITEVQRKEENLPPEVLLPTGARAQKVVADRLERKGKRKAVPRNRVAVLNNNGMQALIFELINI